MSHGLPNFFTAEDLTCGSEPTTGITERVQGEVSCNHQPLALGQWVGASHLRSLDV